MKSRQADLNRSTRGYIRANAHLVAQLPEPGDTWFHRKTDLPDEIKPRLSLFHRHGIISRVGTERFGTSGEFLSEWVTNEGPYELAQSSIERGKQDALLPCGHNSLQNERGVDGLTCGVCETVYSRSEVDA